MTHQTQRGDKMKTKLVLLLAVIMTWSESQKLGGIDAGADVTGSENPKAHTHAGSTSGGTLSSSVGFSDGYSGSWWTFGGDTVTVANGIITSVTS